jgi:hypothetical protein
MGPRRKVGAEEWVGTDASVSFPICTQGNAGELDREVYRPLSFLDRLAGRRVGDAQRDARQPRAGTVRILELSA